MSDVNMASVTLTKTVKTINSFVFLDLETTGLISKGYMPKITELGLVAVSREELRIPEKNPRLLPKLLIPFNPIVEITPEARVLSKLSNEMLENVPPFDKEVFCLMMHFLGRLKEPICFVAHNGRKFDFPILLREFQDEGQAIPPEILSIDSLDAFRHFFQKNAELKKQKLEEKEANSCTIDRNDSFPKDSWDDAVSAALDSIETFPSFDEGIGLEKLDSFDEKRKMRNSMQNINEKTPNSQIIKHQNIETLHSPKNKIRQFLGKPDSMKLGTIFQFLTGSSIEDAHHAESDCLALLRCANILADDFIKFADENARPLANHVIPKFNEV